jgi:hypothetical protein
LAPLASPDRATRGLNGRREDTKARRVRGTRAGFCRWRGGARLYAYHAEVKSQRIVLGVAVVVLATCAVAFLIADGTRAALWPGLDAIGFSAVLYRLVKHPMPPSRWSKRRIIGSAAIGPAAAAVVAALVWVVVVVPDWPTRLLALAGIVLVPAIAFLGVRTARQEDRAARESEQEGPTG